VTGRTPRLGSDSAPETGTSRPRRPARSAGDRRDVGEAAGPAPVGDAVVRSVDTPHGPARLTVHPVPDARGILLLGHGAGGGFGAADLCAATAAALAVGLHVAQVEQPYRVACRTASAAGAVAVLCLAFPVHPPGRPEKDRLAELVAPTVPVLVVQGERDPFGRPPPASGREIVLLAGDHSLKADLPGVTAAVTSWLPGVLPSGVLPS